MSQAKRKTPVKRSPVKRSPIKKKDKPPEAPQGLRTQSTEEIIDAFDINRQTLARWVRQGCPCTRGRGKSNLFDQGEVASWMKAKGLTGAVGRPGGPTSDKLAAAKLRKELAMAELHEIKAARERGGLIDRAEQERENVRKFTVIRNKLLALPATAAAALQGLNALEIQAALEARIRDALTELSRK